MGNILQLLAEILILVVVIPAFFPQMRRSAGHFGVFLGPVCCPLVSIVVLLLKSLRV